MMNRMLGMKRNHFINLDCKSYTVFCMWIFVQEVQPIIREVLYISI